MHIKILSLALGLAVLFSSPTQGAEAEEYQWTAQWIGNSATGDTNNGSENSTQTAANTWCCFRGQVELSAAPKSAVARIACDSKYWLWVNGELVVFEGQLKRGPTPEDTYFDRVELAPYLHKGENVVALLVWHFGKHGMSHKNSGKLGLVFEADIDGEKFVSDRSWRTPLHPAYGNSPMAAQRHSPLRKARGG